jgi:hypothetical protein
MEGKKATETTCPAMAVKDQPEKSVMAARVRHNRGVAFQWRGDNIEA